MAHRRIVGRFIVLAGLLISGFLLLVAVDAHAFSSDGKTRCGGRSLEGLVIERVAPSWPPEPESRMHIKGDVVVLITLDEQGTLRSARATCGHPLKRSFAIEAVRKWRFQPFLKRGKARSVTGIVTVRFPAA